MPLVAAALILLLAALATGLFQQIIPPPPLCTVGGTTTRCASVEGVVVSVSGPGPIDVIGFSLHGDDGETYDFAVDKLDLRDGGQLAPHLREHLRTGLPVIVDYAVRDGALVALRYIDVFASSTPSPSPTNTPAPSPTDTPLTSPPSSLVPSVELVPVASGLGALTFLADDGTGGLYAVEQIGRIIHLGPYGSSIGPPFLDISDQVTFAGEQGLLGLAFNPGYATNGLLYVDYIDLSGDTVVAEYHKDNGKEAPAHVRDLLHITQPFPNHNGGMLVFGPDGLLYISSGDGGSGGDPNGNGQNRASLLGKILRLDVSAPDPQPEMFAYGLRNPWRVDFDPTSGALFIADVGQGSREEIDIVPAGEVGLNFGWNIMEGSQCYQAPSCDETGLTLPVASYATNQSGTCAVIGGYVDRRPGSTTAGMYLFSDYCTGSIYAIDADAALRGEHVARIKLADTGRPVTGFGKDASGNLYVVTQDGVILRLDTTLGVNASGRAFPAAWATSRRG